MCCVVQLATNLYMYLNQCWNRTICCASYMVGNCRLTSCGRFSKTKSGSIQLILYSGSSVCTLLSVLILWSMWSPILFSVFHLILIQWPMTLTLGWEGAIVHTNQEESFRSLFFSQKEFTHFSKYLTYIYLYSGEKVVAADRYRHFPSILPRRPWVSYLMIVVLPWW